MNPYSLFIFLLLTAASSGYGQSIAFNTNGYPGVWNNEYTGYYYGGGGIELCYEHAINEGALLTGFEIRAVDWGNQISVGIGYKVPYMVKDRWTISRTIAANLGMALFHDNPLFVYSLDAGTIFTWAPEKRFSFDAGIRLRFTHCPAYRNYGTINQLIEFPLTIGVRLKLGQLDLK